MAAAYTGVSYRGHDRPMSRVRKPVSFTLYVHRRRGVIHLYAKRGSQELFVTTVSPDPSSERHHAKLYRHLDQLLRAERPERR
jgi:hypothetical protein